jgi:hypothetical protein
MANEQCSTGEALKAIRWTCHAATTVVKDDPSVLTGTRVIAECETEEYARLFAAAPGLLAALRQIDADVEQLGAIDEKTVDQVREAIRGLSA